MANYQNYKLPIKLSYLTKVNPLNIETNVNGYFVKFENVNTEFSFQNLIRCLRKSFREFSKSAS